MSEFNKVDVAKYSPTRCFACGTHEGPFIDTNVDVIEGHVYICARGDTRTGCLEQMARLDGMTNKAAADNMLAEALEQVEYYKALLEQERQSKVISVKDLPELLALAAGPATKKGK
jgi:hypothetical protein